MAGGIACELDRRTAQHTQRVDFKRSRRSTLCGRNSEGHEYLWSDAASNPASGNRSGPYAGGDRSAVGLAGDLIRTVVLAMATVFANLGRERILQERTR